MAASTRRKRTSRNAPFEIVAVRFPEPVMVHLKADVIGTDQEREIDINAADKQMTMTVVLGRGQKIDRTRQQRQKLYSF